MKKRVKLTASENVIEEYYKALVSNNPRAVLQVHIPKSDVFYLRRNIYDNTGVWYTLDHVERAMYVEGHLKRNEVLDPSRKRQFINGAEWF
jgi:hypothetical protein